MALIRTGALIAISILSTIFVVQNLASVEVSFLTWSINAPRALVFAFLLVLGLVAGYLLHATKSGLRGEKKTKLSANPRPDANPLA